MPRYVLAPAAERDIEAILIWSQEQFGEHARIRYEALLVCAIMDVVADPEHAGSLSRQEIAQGARTYHLRYSRDHVNDADERVRRPRHFLLYRMRSDGDVEIARVLHDRMDLQRHLTEEYRKQRSRR